MAVLQAYSGGLRLPGQQPRGRMQINWSHPITNGLSLVWNFADGTNLPVFTANGSFDGSTLNGAPTLGVSQAGIGLTTELDRSGTSYVLPQSAGTFVSYQTLNFVPTDGADHGAQANFSTSTGNFILIRKYSDNNFYVGWQGGSDTRIVASASGAFTKGEAFSSAITWNAANSSLYTKGILRGTNASAPSTGSTSGQQFIVNNDSVAGESSFYYVATWSRELSATELLTLQADPYCFLMPAEGEMPALYNPVVLATGNNPPARRQWTLLPRRGVASATKLPRGITAYWPLDAATCEFGSGQVRPLDLIGNNYGVDAKSTGAAGRPPTDVDGIGYNFDATTSTYLTLNADPLAASSGQANSLTVAAWVNYRSYLTNEGTPSQGPRLFQFGAEVQVLVDDGTDSLGPAGVIYAANNNVGAGVSSGASIAPLNTWTHVAVTFAGRTPTAIYMNGVATALTATGNIGFSSGAGNSIGCRDSAARIMNGKVAHAMVCNGTVLTTSEIADLYNSFFVAEEIMPALFLPSAGGSFLAAWARYSNRPVIGTGNY